METNQTNNRQKILAVLKTADKPMNAWDLSEVPVLASIGAANISSALSFLNRKGFVIMTGCHNKRFHYAAKGKPFAIPDPKRPPTKRFGRHRDGDGKLVGAPNPHTGDEAIDSVLDALADAETLIRELATKAIKFDKVVDKLGFDVVESIIR